MSQLYLPLSVIEGYIGKNECVFIYACQFTFKFYLKSVPCFYLSLLTNIKPKNNRICRYHKH